MNACVLTIGDELLQGFTTDTNSAWLGLTLRPYGVIIDKKITVGDKIDDIINEAEKILNENYDLFIVTGGLGPTHDDVTKDAFKKLLNLKLVFDKLYYKKLTEKYIKKSISISKINRSQAMIFENSNIIPNKYGTALGTHYCHNQTQLIILPGVPNEMKYMVRNYVIPKLINKEYSSDIITIKTAGIIESKLSEIIEDLMKKYSNSYRFSFLPHVDGVSFRINNVTNMKNINQVAKIFFDKMRPFSYGYGDDTLMNIIDATLKQKKLTIAVAESCTGGSIGKALTEISGSSRYFLGGIIAYSNKMKNVDLGIPNKLIVENGAVSEEVAVQMSRKIKDKTNADIGISCTGISGPDGGTKTKPLGLVYLSLTTNKKSIVKKFIFNYDRFTHRKMATVAALNILRLYLETDSNIS